MVLRTDLYKGNKDIEPRANTLKKNIRKKLNECFDKQSPIENFRN